MNEILPDLTPEILQARLITLEAGFAMLVRMQEAERAQMTQHAVEDIEKYFFKAGLPAGCLPLGAQIARLRQLVKPAQ